MDLSDWTPLAIAGSAAIGGAALILRTRPRALTFARHWQRVGEFAVFDALFSVGLKPFAKPGRLQLAIYVTMRKLPSEAGERQGCDADEGERPAAIGSSSRPYSPPVLPPRAAP